MEGKQMEEDIARKKPHSCSYLLDEMKNDQKNI